MVKKILIPKEKRRKSPAKETADLTPQTDSRVTEIGRMVVEMCEKLPQGDRPEGWKRLKAKLAERR